MSSRTDHWKVADYRDKWRSKEAAAKKRLKHRDYWEEQLDLLQSTVYARRRLMRIDSVRLTTGLILKWKTGDSSFSMLCMTFSAAVGFALAAGISDLEVGIKLITVAVLMAVAILVAMLALMMKPKTYQVILSPGDPVVEWVLGAVSVNEKRKERRIITRELARHAQCVTTPGESLAQKLIREMYRDA